VQLLLADADAGQYRPAAGAGTPLAGASALAALLRERRIVLTREQLAEDPHLRAVRTAADRDMDGLGAAAAVPIFFRGALTALLVLGPRRADLAYTTEDLRVLRVLANQSAVALEHARAYTALQAANAELEAALRRVAILESIRTNLAKFVPRTVHELIEQAPHAPELEKREVDVTVLFVDIAGYTRLSERFDLDTLNRMVERYFSAFLDEILAKGGDVNETAGDGLMAIFRDSDGDGARHARAAVHTALGIVRRAHAINAELAGVAEPIELHVGVNSGVAALGATKIEARPARGAGRLHPVTNVAARLAALGAGDAVYVGGDATPPDDGLALDDLSEHRLRTWRSPRVFCLKSGRPPLGSRRDALARAANAAARRERAEPAVGPGARRTKRTPARWPSWAQERRDARDRRGHARRAVAEQPVRDRRGADAGRGTAAPRARAGAGGDRGGHGSSAATERGRPRRVSDRRGRSLGGHRVRGVR
jgi:class 3 adenylate cyclase